MIRVLQRERRTPRTRPRGFTLLELLIVMFLAGIVLSSAIALLNSPDDEKRLVTQISQVEQLGRQARGLAVLQQRPYSVRFTQGFLHLQPLGHNAEDGDLDRDQEDVSSAESITESLELDPEVEFSLRHWQQDWVLIEDLKEGTEWVFEPNGLVEPISVKVQYDRSWIQQTYHSLTGEVVEEEREVY